MNEQTLSDMNYCHNMLSVNVELSEDELHLLSLVRADEDVSRILNNPGKYRDTIEYSTDLSTAVARVLIRKHIHGARAHSLTIKFIHNLMPLLQADLAHLSFRALQRAGDPALVDYRDMAHWQQIRERAMQILAHGDPIEFIVQSCSRQCVGAETAFRKLICCISVQNIRQSQGLHPKLSGESGSGKTFALSTFAHHLPLEMVIAGSTSSLAAFYHQDGDRLLRILDDYDGSNDTLDAILKQTTSVFHQRYKHRTVDIKRQAATLEIGSEQTWAITSVDASQDIQVLNRQIPINVSDSRELTMQINQRLIERYGRGEVTYGLDDDVLTCREIFRIMRDEPLIDVRVPFYDRIEWLDTSNRRNVQLFMDMMIAHTGMYRYQRQKDAEGYYLATEDDFHAARELFAEGDASALVRRFTNKELEVVKIL